MIHYQLRCAEEHGFDGWFKDSASFDRQAATGLVICPTCSSGQVTRALMAPALGRGSAKGLDPVTPSLHPGARDAPMPAVNAASEPAAPQPGAMAASPVPANLRALLQRLRADVEKNCDYVGPDFADEARKMHSGERKTRGIYGETTRDDAEALGEEGIDFGVLPWVPRADS